MNLIKACWACGAYTFLGFVSDLEAYSGCLIIKAYWWNVSRAYDRLALVNVKFLVESAEEEARCEIKNGETAGLQEP